MLLSAQCIEPVWRILSARCADAAPPHRNAGRRFAEQLPVPVMHEDAQLVDRAIVECDPGQGFAFPGGVLRRCIGLASSRFTRDIAVGLDANRLFGNIAHPCVQGLPWAKQLIRRPCPPGVIA